MDGATLEPTPIFTSLVSEVLTGASVARDRLSTVRTGIDRLHAPDQFERCPVCREDWPCTTRRLVDGLSRGELEPSAGLDLVDEALEQEVIDLDEELGGPFAADETAAGEVAAPRQATELRTWPAFRTYPQDEPAAQPGPVSGPPPEEPRPQPEVPAFADLLGGGKTRRALDVLFGGPAD
jgi:hypothetical protein